MERVREPRVIIETRVTIGQVEAQGIAARLTDLAGLKLGQLVHILPDLRGHQPQQPPALAGDLSRQGPNARLASATARSTRSGPPLITLAICCPVAGSITANVSASLPR